MPRKKTRQEKYDLLTMAGLTPSEARQARDWSWKRIREEIGNLPKTDPSFIEQRTSHLPRSERLKQADRLLRQAGYTREEAYKLRTKPLDQIQTLVAVKQQKEPHKAKEFDRKTKRYKKTDKPLLYGPMDKAYRHDYAYRIGTRILYDQTDQQDTPDKEIDYPPHGTEQIKYWTIVSPDPLTEAEIMHLILDEQTGMINSLGAHYGSRAIEIVSITPMTTLLGGVSYDD